MRRKHKIRLTSIVGICTAFALILSYVELLLPPLYVAVPGIKMGLANIAVIFVLYRLSLRSAVYVSILRVILVSMLFSNAMALAYSVSGAVLSLCVMALAKRTGLLSWTAHHRCTGLIVVPDRAILTNGLSGLQCPQHRN